MRRPPACVALVARTHWTVGLVIALGTVAGYAITRNLPRVEFGTRTFFTAGGLAALYLLAGTLVWFGAPLGPLVSRICGLLYLPRPQFGSHLWETMNSPEFKAHFRRGETAKEGNADLR